MFCSKTKESAIDRCLISHLFISYFIALSIP
ncbi:MAG: hypothetical protein E7081_00465 [Bacteroidales bacterium]|nr:hypothetical protein [Bacteroidales bacterium]